MAGVCPSYTIRNATRADVAVIKVIVDIEGWELDLNFLYCMYDLDSRAWFVAEISTGDIIGVRALVYFNDRFTAGGIYIVEKDYRGHGVGGALNTAALNSVGDSNVIISASDVNLYNTRGFTHDFDIYLQRLNVGVILDALPVGQLSKHVTITPHTDALLSDVIRYDSAICKHERPEYVLKWVIQTAERILVACTEDINTVGYGCLRMTEYGYQITPLYADSEVIAWSLLRELLRQLDRSNNVDLFICSGNEITVNLLKSLPHQNVITLHKMYNRKHVQMSLTSVYSLSSMAMAVL